MGKLGVRGFRGLGFVGFGFSGFRVGVSLLVASRYGRNGQEEDNCFTFAGYIGGYSGYLFLHSLLATAKFRVPSAGIKTHAP